MENSSFSRIIMKEGPVTGEIFPFNQDEMIFGRSEGSDLVIDSPGVSRRHARIMRVKNGYQLEDLGSSNGTYVNGNRLITAHLLQRGDVIRLGGTVVFEYCPAEAEVTHISTPRNPAATLAEQMAWPCSHRDWSG
jgi:pSer/pThr/pTyr-binding forkhead associated (FHA) protein